MVSNKPKRVKFLGTTTKSSSNSKSSSGQVIRDSIRIGGTLVTGYTDTRTGQFSPDSSSQKDFEQIQRATGTTSTSKIREIAATPEVKKIEQEVKAEIRAQNINITAQMAKSATFREDFVKRIQRGGVITQQDVKTARDIGIKPKDLLKYADNTRKQLQLRQYRTDNVSRQQNKDLFGYYNEQTIKQVDKIAKEQKLNVVQREQLLRNTVRGEQTQPLFIEQMSISKKAKDAVLTDIKNSNLGQSDKAVLKRAVTGQTMTKEDVAQFKDIVGKQNSNITYQQLKNTNYTINLIKNSPKDLFMAGYEVGEELANLTKKSLSAAYNYGYKTSEKANNNKTSVLKYFYKDLSKVVSFPVKSAYKYGYSTSKIANENKKSVLNYFYKDAKAAGVVVGAYALQIGTDLKKDFLKNPVKTTTKAVIYMFPETIFAKGKTGFKTVIEATKSQYRGISAPIYKETNKAIKEYNKAIKTLAEKKMVTASERRIILKNAILNNIELRKGTSTTKFLEFLETKSTKELDSLLKSNKLRKKIAKATTIEKINKALAEAATKNTLFREGTLKEVITDNIKSIQKKLISLKKKYGLKTQIYKTRAKIIKELKKYYTVQVLPNNKLQLIKKGKLITIQKGLVKKVSFKEKIKNTKENILSKIKKLKINIKKIENYPKNKLINILKKYYNVVINEKNELILVRKNKNIKLENGKVKQTPVKGTIKERLVKTIDNYKIKLFNKKLSKFDLTNPKIYDYTIKNKYVRAYKKLENKYSNKALNLLKKAEKDINKYVLKLKSKIPKIFKTKKKVDFDLTKPKVYDWRPINKYQKLFNQLKNKNSIKGKNLINNIQKAIKKSKLNIKIIKQPKGDITFDLTKVKIYEYKGKVYDKNGRLIKGVNSKSDMQFSRRISKKAVKIITKIKKKIYQKAIKPTKILIRSKIKSKKIDNWKIKIYDYSKTNKNISSMFKNKKGQARLIQQTEENLNKVNQELENELENARKYGIQLQKGESITFQIGEMEKTENILVNQSKLLKQAKMKAGKLENSLNKSLFDKAIKRNKLVLSKLGLLLALYKSFNKINRNPISLSKKFKLIDKLKDKIKNIDKIKIPAQIKIKKQIKIELKDKLKIQTQLKKQLKEQIKEQIKIPKFKLRNKIINEPPIEPPKPPKLWNLKSKLPKGYTYVYDAKIRVKGKVKTIKLGLPTNRALSKVGKLIDNTTSRSMQLVPVGIIKKTKDISKPSILGKFRVRKTKKALLLVEKSKYSIDTSGEKKGLSIGKLLSPKKKTKKASKKKIIKKSSSKNKKKVKKTITKTKKSSQKRFKAVKSIKTKRKSKKK